MHAINSVKDYQDRIKQIIITKEQIDEAIRKAGQEIDRISEFLTSLESVRRYELLPYHPIGNAKREAMGLECPRFTVPTGEYMEELKKYVFIR